jgi:hypothetical protein
MKVLITEDTVAFSILLSHPHSQSRNIILNSLTPLYISLEVRDQISHPYKTNSTNIEGSKMYTHLSAAISFDSHAIR